MHYRKSGYPKPRSYKKNFIEPFGYQSKIDTVEKIEINELKYWMISEMCINGDCLVLDKRKNEFADTIYYEIIDFKLTKVDIITDTGGKKSKTKMRLSFILDYINNYGNEITSQKDLITKILLEWPEKLGDKDSEDTIKKAIQKGEKEGLIIKTKDGRNNVYKVKN